MPGIPAAWAVLLLLGTGSAAAQVAPVSVPARDGLSLHGTLYRASGRAPLVLMFHQCNRSGPETGYEGLGRRLAAAGMHAFALDSRGFGRSVNAQFSDFRSRSEETAAHWPADADAVLRHLGGRPGIDTSRMAAIGASCGVDQAVHLAGRWPAVRGLVALSGSLQPAADSAFTAMRRLPAFIVFADEDGYNTPPSMRAMYATARDQRSRLINYRGALHGTPLLAADPALEPAVTAWLGSLLGVAAPVATPGDTAVFHGEIADIENGRVLISVVARGLAIPSALAFLPDGRALLAERMAGRLSLLDPGSGALTPLRGMPPMHRAADGEQEGGLFDVQMHPDFGRNGWIYLSYSEGTVEGNTTVVDRVKLDGTTLTSRQRIFTALPHVQSSIHFGGRMALVGGYLYLTVGERNERERAQDLAQHHGKIIRVHDDGRVPKDNPFIRRTGALPEIWSYGHRNPQGLALNPADGRLWEHEHGPRGGDEVNIVRRGANYGWPSITYGREYTGEEVGAGVTAKEGLEQPVYYWLPSIAPGGMDFYHGTAFPRWNGSLLAGAMARGHLSRLVVRDGRVLHEERIPAGKRWRVRLVRAAPDGAVWLGTDAGYLLRLTAVGEPQAKVSP